MFPFGRFLRVLATARFRPRIPPMGESVVTFRVWPGDLDTNRHMNNGRFLTLMDLGRWDLMARMGMIPKLMERRWYPVVGSATIRYRRSLKPFAKFELRTSILGWDGGAFFLEQRFERAGEVIAVGVIRGTFLGPQGKLPASEIIALVEPGRESPPLPAWVELWNKSQEALSADLAAGRG